MNLIIMCCCSLFINFSYLEVGYALKNFPRLNKPQCDDVISDRCFSQSGNSENKVSLVNVLLEEKESKELKNAKGYERLQLVLPAFKEQQYKNSKRPNENANCKKQRTQKWRKKVEKSKSHNNSLRLRHSRKKLARKRNLWSKRRFNITFENRPKEISKPILPNMNLLIFKNEHKWKNEMDGKRRGNFSMTTREFKNRRIPKGLLKGGKGRWRHFNPSRGAKKVIVRTHNILRGRVWPPAENMLAISWNSDAAEAAQLWADECRLDTEMDHPSVRWTPMYGTCGQNVHLTFKKKRWGRVVRHWWNERQFFYYGHPRNNVTKVGRYTQMVWYNSHKVGCGFAQCETPSGKKPFHRYVCNYCPSGNDPRRLSRPYDKGPQCRTCPSSCISVCNRVECKLCTNSCPFADLWSNCENLALKWKQWLCNTKTRDGVMRFKNCRATCQCSDKIT